MELKYVKADPSGNTTVFILSPVPRKFYAMTAEVVMSMPFLAAEQVGYVTPSKNQPNRRRMEMMGGEFCGNASRSFAAWQALYDIGTDTFKNFSTKEITLDIDVSGSDKILQAVVHNTNSAYSCNVALGMPIPKWICEGENPQLGQYSIVSFVGITHIILWNRAPQENDIEISKTFLGELGVSTDAFGVMFYQTTNNKLTPVVSIAKVGSLIWENSCGSGSTAVAAALSHRKKSGVDLLLHQPGGDLSVKVDWNEKINRIFLSGEIRFTSSGTLFIEDQLING